jgi:hypothetical protein
VKRKSERMAAFERENSNNTRESEQREAFPRDCWRRKKRERKNLGHGKILCYKTLSQSEKKRNVLPYSVYKLRLHIKYRREAKIL